MKLSISCFLAAAMVVKSQTVTPPTIEITDSSPVCSGSSVTEKVCIELPPDATSTKVDVFLLFDDTGSFTKTVPAVQKIFRNLVNDLQSAAPNVDFAFGVGRFEDYGGSGNEFSGDYSSARPFILNQPIVNTADAGGDAELDTVIGDALLRVAPGYGGDGPESAIAEGLYQVATGVGFDGDGDGSTTGESGRQHAGALDTQTAPDDSGDVPAFSTLDPSVKRSGKVGGAGFRPDALKLVVLATDICSVASFDPSEAIPSKIVGSHATVATSTLACLPKVGSARYGFVSDSLNRSENTVKNAVVPKGAGTVPAAVSALSAAGIRVLGLYANGPLPFLESLALLTGAVDSNGNALTFSIASGGTGLAKAIVNAVSQSVVKPIDIALKENGGVESVLINTPSDAVKAVAPGGTACFNVTITGTSETIDGMTALDFVDAASGLTLGSTSVLLSCQGDSSCTNSITGFTLIDAATGTEKGPLEATMSESVTQGVNIRADFVSCDATPIQSVLVEFDKDHSYCELYTPYAVFQDDNESGMNIPPDASHTAQYNAVNIAVGTHIVKATPFASPNCTGDVGEAMKLEFTVTTSEATPCPGTVVGFKLYNGDTDKVVSDMFDGQELCNPPYKFNIEAVVDSCDGPNRTRSVRMELTGRKVRNSAENLVPYMLWGDKPGKDIFGKKVPLGKYTLTSTPYSGQDALGMAGTAKTLHFTIIECDGTAPQ